MASLEEEVRKGESERRSGGSVGGLGRGMH